MPWKIQKNGDQYCVHKENADGTVGERVKCHDSEDKAKAHMRALYANVEDAKALDETLVTVGGELKALGDGKVGGYLVMFGDSETPDVSPMRDFFTRATDFDLDDDGSGKSSVLYHHGLDPVIGKRKLATASLRMDDVGVWMEAQLKLRDDYERAIYELVQGAKMGLSSGTAPHLVEREARNNGTHEITRWPLGLDASITPMPAEPRTRVLPIKAYLDEAQPYAKAIMPQDDALQASSAEAAQDGDTPDAIDQPTSITESDTMSDETKQTATEQPLDVDAIVKAAADAAAAAVYKKFQDEPAINPPGVETKRKPSEVKDNRPAFKSFGEFLMTVARADGHGHRDERLLAIKSDDPIDEGGYSVTKAMGTEFVGDMADLALKLPSGMSEGIGSDGGFLVQTDTSTNILARVYNVGEILRRVDMTTISANSNAMTFYAEDETSRADGSRRGGILAYWRAEAGTVTASQPNFREINLKLKSLMALVYATDELLNDAQALGSWVMRNLPEELRFVAENSIINGTGAGMPQGILNAGALISVTPETGQAAATVVSANIWKMYARMYAPSVNRAVWLISQSVWPELFNLSIGVGTGGSALFVPPGGISAAPYGTLMGRPVIPVEYMPAVGTVGDIMFVDLGEYQAITKGGIAADQSMHVRFINGEQTFRFIWRIDGQSKWNSALTPFNAGDTQSPFIALTTRS